MNSEILATGKVKSNGNKRKIAPTHVEPEAKKPYYRSKFMNRSAPKKTYSYYFIDTPLAYGEIDNFFKTLFESGYPLNMVTSYKFEQSGKREYQPDGTSSMVPKFHTEIRIKCEPEFDIHGFAHQFFQDSEIRPMEFDQTKQF